jgi:hypothetical protein
MSRPTNRISLRARVCTVAGTLCVSAVPVASAQSEGGLYIAGAGFTFQQAAQQGIAKHPGGQRFFVLAIPPETRAMTTTASGQLAAARERVIAAGGVLYVCQRDIDNGKIAAASLAPGVLAVRGWPRVRTDAMPLGARYFKDEDPATLPASNNALRQLRSACAS